MGTTYAVGLVKGVTYKIIGGDGREYGPVTLDEIRAWIVGERVGRMTRTWSSEDDRWMPAEERAELLWDLPPAPPTPPILPDPAALPGDPGWMELIEQGPVTASLRLRIAAIVFDYIVFSILLSILTAPWAEEFVKLQQAAMASLSKRENDPALTLALLRAELVSLVPVSFLYYGLLTWVFGGTPGKLLVGLRVAQLDGTPVTWLRALLRWLLCLICFTPFGLGFLPVFFTLRRQSLPDLISGTFVIHAPRR